MADVIMKKRFERIELSLPGKKILDGRRLLKIELVDSNGRLLKFHQLVTPKLEPESGPFAKKIVDPVNYFLMGKKRDASRLLPIRLS